MAANIGPHKVASAAAERAEIRSAVRHHDPVDPRPVRLGRLLRGDPRRRESDLIDESEMLGTVRRPPGRSRADVP